MPGRRSLLVALAVLTMGIALGCNALFGVTDYVVVNDDAALVETGVEAGEGGDGARCEDFDPVRGQCYPCPPATDLQILNVCTGAQCVPFDDKARVPNLPADGVLPPVPDLPPADAGAG